LLPLARASSKLNKKSALFVNAVPPRSARSSPAQLPLRTLSRLLVALINRTAGRMTVS
jgi:hypothetical protein